MSSDLIQDQIDITKQMIKRYEMALLTLSQSLERRYSYEEILDKLNKEKEMLENLRSKYPEYFI